MESASAERGAGAAAALVLALLAAGCPMASGWQDRTFTLGGDTTASPLLVDVSGDGRPALLLTESRPGGGPAGSSRVTLFAPNGKALAGWPVAVSELVAGNGLAAGDLDADGKLELIAVDVRGRLHAWRADGSALAGYPIEAGRGMPLGPPLVTDLDGDGRAEVVFPYTDMPTIAPGNGAVVVSGGRVRAGWPIEMVTPPLSNVLPLDVDGDAKPELLLVGADGWLRAYGLDGAVRAAPAVDLGAGGWTLLAADMGGAGKTLLAISQGAGFGTIRAMDVAGRDLGWPAETREPRWGAAALVPWAKQIALAVADTRASRIRVLNGAGAEVAAVPFDPVKEGMPYGYASFRRGASGVELLVALSIDDVPDWDYHFERLASPEMRARDAVNAKVLDKMYPPADRAADPAMMSLYSKERRDGRQGILLELAPEVVPAIVAASTSLTVRSVALAASEGTAVARLEGSTARLRDFIFQDVCPAAAVDADGVVIAVASREGKVVVTRLAAKEAPRVYWGAPLGGPGHVPVLQGGG